MYQTVPRGVPRAYHGAMAVNVALVTARRRAGLSQDGLARRLQQVGHKLGWPNECTRGNVHRWEHGGHPQAHYVVLLEAALGQPAADLGLAYEGLDMDRDQMLASAGLDTAPPVPDPSVPFGGYGSLTGIWLSRYEYPSSSRGQVLASSHYVLILQRGAHLNVRSLPGQQSRLSLDLAVNGKIAQGTWTEHTAETGYYSGAIYTGTIQLELNQAGDRLKGRWLGFGRDPGEINDGPWQFTRVDDKIDADTRNRWDRNPDVAGLSAPGTLRTAGGPTPRPAGPRGSPHARSGCDPPAAARTPGTTRWTGPPRPVPARPPCG